MSARYRSSFWKPEGKGFGPEFFEAHVKPTEYRGYLIYQRIKGVCWDVVKDGACLDQRAGLSGARAAVDRRLARDWLTAAE